MSLARHGNLDPTSTSREFAAGQMKRRRSADATSFRRPGYWRDWLTLQWVDAGTSAGACNSNWMSDDKMTANSFIQTRNPLDIVMITAIVRAAVFKRQAATARRIVIRHSITGTAMRAPSKRIL
jgi:hypothetical protein